MEAVEDLLEWALGEWDRQSGRGAIENAVSRITLHKAERGAGVTGEGEVKRPN